LDYSISAVTAFYGSEKLMPTVVITGASRGIGLEFVRQYAADGWKVIALCRNPAAATNLAALAGDVHVAAIDVDDTASVNVAAAALKGAPVDLLINNAGINIRGATLADVDYDGWLRNLDTNILGPMRVSHAFLPAIEKGTGKKLVFISSKMGSIAENTGGGMIYRSSKTGLNMAVSCLSLELAPKAITSLMFHPGHVQTDMGGARAPVTVTDSVTGMRQVINSAGMAENGHFFNYDGALLPW
jgi:NAD(P)-dependent dehydrogenase (short-subunit alcohol dehydrogenase family)